MRSFVALSLPSVTCDALGALQAHLRVGRLIDEDNLHLTLAFLDDQPEQALDDLHAELEPLRISPFALQFRGTGGFGGSVLRNVHAAIKPSAELTRLHTDIQRAARRAGVVVARRRFVPHVTLARLKPHDADGAASFLRDTIAFRHDSPALFAFGLYRSTLAPTGAQYDALETYPLRGF